MDEGLPTPSQRLFAHYSAPQQLPHSAPRFVIARLLEEGNSRDLLWLTRRYSEQQLANWLQENGARRLSRRSCRFWELVLSRAATPATATRGELWPL